MKKPSIKVGDIFPTNKSGSCTVVTYVDCRSIEVQFADGTTLWTRSDLLRDGSTFNPSLKTTRQKKEKQDLLVTLHKPSKSVTAFQEKHTLDALTNAYQTIVDHLQLKTEQADNQANFEGSAKRAAKALLEMTNSDKKIKTEIKAIISKAFPITRQEGSVPELIIQGPIRVNCICPHHLLPWFAEAFVAYIPEPEGNVLGLSKMPRLVKELAKRPVLQEKLASDIAAVLHAQKGQYFPGVVSQGSAVSLVGLHSCVACRGVESDSKTGTVVMRGCFQANDLEQKFYAAVDRINKTNF